MTVVPLTCIKLPLKPAELYQEDDAVKARCPGFRGLHDAIICGINAAGHAGVRYKHFLYSYLKDQPIWQSLRFWNAAFFDAVQSERSHKPLCTRKDNREARTTDKEFQENITFGQLGTFTCNMRAFGLQKDLCLEFLRKQSTIANLREEQVNMLRENVEKWKE